MALLGNMNLDLGKPKDRRLFFCKQVDQASIESLMKNIIEINENDRFLKKQYKLYGFKYKVQPIEIYIDSYGGAVYQIMGLVSIMQNSKTPIHTICTGAAMSCGFIMLINGHRRFCYEHGTPLYHQVGSAALGKVEDMKQKTKEAKRLQKKIEVMTVKLTKIKMKKLLQIKKEKVDWYMTSKEAKKLGVIDEII